MRKAPLTEALIGTAFGAIALLLGLRLARYDVPPAVSAIAVISVIGTGAAFARLVGQQMRTTVFTCPVKGCARSIRAAGTTDDELAQLRALATDHSKHGSN